MEALAVGQTIPSERHLTQELGVSRLTIRAALDELVRDGYLDRRHGSGTYVTEPKIAQPLTLTSFSDDMGGGGWSPAAGPSSSSLPTRGRGWRAVSRARPRHGWSASSACGLPTTSRWPWRCCTFQRLSSRA